VKRIFAARSFTLERLDHVCSFLGIEINDLAKMGKRQPGAAFGGTGERTGLVERSGGLVWVERGVTRTLDASWRGVLG
jgi:hypothetical protein